MEVRYLIPNLLEEDIEFRERLVEHLIAYSEMFNGIEARSIVSASILLYGTPERNPTINNIIRFEPIPPWIESFTLNIREQNISYNIPIHREFIQQRLGDVYYMCSGAIDQVYFNQTMRQQDFSQDELTTAQTQLRTLLIDLEAAYLHNTRRDNNITNMLRRPQGRLFLDIQVISNFFAVVEDLRTTDDRRNENTVIALRN